MPIQTSSIWVSFNRNGSICATRIDKPDRIDDGYNNTWVEMVPTANTTHHADLIDIKVSKDFQLNEDTQGVTELWKSIADLAGGRVNDSRLSEHYPINVRIKQLASLASLVQTLDATHISIIENANNENLANKP